MRCAVFGCNVDDQSKHFKKGEVMFFRFPTDALILKAWQNACSRKDKFNTTNARVCSKHFKATDYERNLKCELLGYAPPKNRRLIKPGVVPTENLPNKPSSSIPPPWSSASERLLRAEKRSRSSLVQELLHQQQTEKEKVKLKLSTEEIEVCTLCIGRSKLEPVGKELNNFGFIEVEIGYMLPERVCKECLRKLNDIASFIKMCKDSLDIYTKIEEHQNRNAETDVNEKLVITEHTVCESNELHELSTETEHQNRSNESDVDEKYLTTERIGSESSELNELSSDAEHQNGNNQSHVDETFSTTEHIGSESNELKELSSETCKPAASTQDEKETIIQETETEPNIPDELQDHVYFRVNNKIINANPRNEMKTCPTCGESVPGLGAHYKKSPRCRPRNIQCPVCHVRCKDRHKMLNHQKAHHPENVSMTLFMCHICSKTFKYEPNLTRHLRVHKHGKRFICEQCGKGYTTAENLRDHQNVHLNMKQFLCAKCGKQFSTKLNLRVHERGCKRNAVRTRKLRRITEGGNQVREGELVACKICDRKFLGHGLKVHMHTHHEDKTYCRKCNVEFETTVLYRQHLKIHAKKDATCPYCSKSYPRTGIKQHIATHTQDRPFSCPECDKKFRTQIHLSSHRLGLHNINRGKPLRCKYCDQVFTFRGNLRVHERIHTGEKPYSCHVCNEAFSDTKKRKKHVAQVHGEDEVLNI